MLEMIMFSVVFCLVFFALSLGFTCLMFSKWMMNKITKKSMDMTKTIITEMEKEDWL